jgi:hypothetical protein
MDQVYAPQERVTSIVLAYYRQADELLPSASELVAWLAGCRPEVQA